MQFGESLSAILVEKGIGVAALAKAIRVSVATVYTWKNNTHEPNAEYLHRMADYFHCSVEYLIGRTDTNIPTRRIPVDFETWLKTILKEKGISGYQLGKTTRFRAGYFSKWKAGSSPYLSTLLDLSEILDCTIDYLIGRE